MIATARDRYVRLRLRGVAIAAAGAMLLAATLAVQRLSVASANAASVTPRVLASACEYLSLPPSTGERASAYVATHQPVSIHRMKDAWTEAGCAPSIRTIAQDGMQDGIPIPILVQRRDFPESWGMVVGQSGYDSKVCVVESTGKTQWWPWSRFKSAYLDAGVLLQCAHAHQGAKLWMPQGDLQLGVIEKEQIAIRNVTLFNVGDSPFYVQDQRFSCGCTTADLETKMIPQGGHCRAKVSIDLRGMDARRFEVDWIIAPDGGAEAATFRLSAEVRARPTLSPDYVALGSVRPDEPVRKVTTVLAIDSSDDREFSLDPVFLDRGLKLKGIENGRRPVISLAVDARDARHDQRGFFSTEATFAIRCDDEESRLVTFGVAGRLEPWIRAYPAVVNVGRCNAGETIKRSVQIRSYARGRVIVHAVHPEYVRTHVHGDVVDLDVTAPPEPAVFKTGILIRVGDESVSVPIIGSLRTGREQGGQAASNGAARAREKRENS